MALSDMYLVNGDLTNSQIYLKPIIERAHIPQ